MLNSDPNGIEIPRVAIETLGCKLNQAESESLKRELLKSGCRIVTSEEPADIFILNSCTVTHVADRKGRQILRQARRLSPGARIVVIGCYDRKSTEQLSGIEGIDLLVGNDRKTELIKVLGQKGWIPGSSPKVEAGFQNRTRTFIKAQDGCNNHCSYCIVPTVRGREKSLPPQLVVDEIRQRAAEGYQEAVLTGTEIGRYSSSETRHRWTYYGKY